MMLSSVLFDFKGKSYRCSLDRPLDISIPVLPGEVGVNCFFAPPPEAWPVKAGSFIGDTTQGGSVNFFNLRINPHGNGTHTECVGHISRDRFSINQCLRRFHFAARLISVYPVKMENGDRVIRKEDLLEWLSPGEVEALIIRTLPNDRLKMSTNYSGANPPYLEEAAINYLVECGIEHLLVDLPSVDREEDEGRLLAHRAFWRFPGETRLHCTISELIYADPVIADGMYLLNLQIASLELDVSPSKPVLYIMEEVDSTP